MPFTTNQGYISSGFDHSKMFNDSFITGRFDHSGKIENSVSANSTDLFGLQALRCALVNPSRQPSPSILNLTAEKSLSTRTDSCGLESSIMNVADGVDSHGFGVEITGPNPRIENVRTPKLMLDLSRVKNSILSSRSGSSPPFSDSSLSTSSSYLDVPFFPPNIQTGRSDSPNSEASNSSSDSVTHQNFSFPQLTDQEYMNLQNLHLINCMSSMSNEQFLQTINMIQSVLQLQNQTPQPIIKKDTLELEARYHRTAAISGNAEAQFTWSGKLPKRSYKGGPYSSKVFLGGVPWEITEDVLTSSFSHFGNVKVEWPGKEAISQPKGYAYIIFENEMQVKLLLDACREGNDDKEGSFYYKIPSRRSKPKEVQVIPWSINDSNYSIKTFQKLDPLKTVFVGALHGMMTAEGLFRVMDDLFGGVLYAGIDTDKNKYPIGSGRVTFISYKSYVKAVTAAFVDIKTPKFSKKVQLDPYIEDTPCSLCKIQLGPYFCRENGCFRYFCTKCWELHHMPMRSSPSHKPLTRNSKRGAYSQ